MSYVETMYIFPAVHDQLSAAKPYVRLSWNLDTGVFTRSCQASM